MEVIRVSWIVILHARNLFFLDILLFIFKCKIILVVYPLVIPSISDLTEQSQEQTMLVSGILFMCPNQLNL